MWRPYRAHSRLGGGPQTTGGPSGLLPLRRRPTRVSCPGPKATARDGRCGIRCCQPPRPGPGVYGLDKNTVVARAAQGWLALNVMPHDLPLYESPAFYAAQQEGPLRDFSTIGNHDHSQAYLRGILLRAARAVDYLATRPDWDGRTLITTGTSMGGFQAIAVAALDARVTAVAANVPAACEHSATLFGRGAAWPYWLKDPPEADVLDPRHRAGQILDAVHFASRVQVPALISAGLIDTSCPPSGILAMASKLRGPVQLILMPLAPHQDPHTAFHDAAASFITPLPPTPSP